jgi:DNA-binding response OmpR family regulator
MTEGGAAAAGPILVVEDERPLRETIVLVLQDEGMAATGAANGKAALEMASRSRPALVVLDMALPLLNGDGVADGLRRLYGEVPILLTTADGRAAEKATRVGAYAYLQKPFDLEALLRLVREGLEQAS